MDITQKAQPKVVAIIPARYHSNRFEGKPLAKILGKPMIQHVYERAWPAFMTRPITAFCTAASMSASSSTMNGSEPPSSST